MMTRMVSLEALEARIGRALLPEELKQFALLTALSDLAQHAQRLRDIGREVWRVDVVVAAEAIERVCTDLIKEGDPK